MASNEVSESSDLATARVSSSRQESGSDIVRVRDASVQFSMDRGVSTVLDGVDLNIREGETLGIVGESGSGKSMFASALLDAVVDPGQLSGEITFYPDTEDEVDLLDLSEEELRHFRWEQVSFVFQGAMSSFNPTKTIRGHFEETVIDHGGSVEEGIDRARELLTAVHLDAERVLDSYPHELSGGMKQRALIALGLVLKPDVLVLDEPTAALDLLMQQSILQLLEDIKEEYDLTVVFITHDLPLVSDICDRIAVMYAFDFAEVGPTDAILERPTHPYTRALLKSAPNLDISLSAMQPIEGSSPDPVNVPSGCSFHPRCPLADEYCETDDPPYYEVDADHRTACHYWEESADEVSLEIDVSEEASEESGGQTDRSGQPVVSMNDMDVHFEDHSGGLTNFFGDPDTVHAVDDVDLDVYENDVVVLVGESGCGKTTLGKAAIGVERPTDGSVEYRGQDIWEARDGSGDVDIPFEEIRRSLQIIHQDPGSSLNPNRTVLASLEMPLKRWHSGMNIEERHERIHRFLSFVGMTPAEDYASRYPHQLSGGEKQRVALIRALLMSPDLILADEAISALDVSLRIEMMDLLLEMQSMFDTSFLFISHDLANARYIAENAGGRIGVMYLGELVEIGSADQIINDPQHPYTKVLRWATADIQSEDSTEGAPIREIDVPDPVNPPSGCRFHTRCPEAREVCTSEHPEMDRDGGHGAACFRTRDESHPYWDSQPLPGTE